MPEPWRRTGRSAGADHFVGLEPHGIVECAAYHDDGSRMGHFICQLEKLDPLGSDRGVGKTWTGRMLAIEDPYYQWWFESTFGKLEDEAEAFFHFCIEPQKNCSHVGGYRELVHVDVFRMLQPHEAANARWLTAEQKAAIPGRVRHQGGVDPHAAGRSGTVPPVQPGAAGVTGLRAALEGVGGAEPGGVEPLEDEPQSKRRRERSPAHDKKRSLDDPLSDDGGEEDYAQVLQKRKPAKQVESALRLRRSKKKKKGKKRSKKRDEKDEGEKKKKKAEKSSDESSSDSSSGSSVFRLAPLPEGIDRLKRTHLKRPSRLADLTLQRYQELLLRSTGRGAEEEDMSVLPAVARAYLQQVYFVKNPAIGLGQRTAREMKTIMLVLDLLARNMVPSAMDVLVQRQKALELSVEQGNWSQANLLELVDMEEARSYFLQEVKAAQTQLRAEQRLGKGRGYQRGPPWWNAPPADPGKGSKENKDGDVAPTNDPEQKGGKKSRKGRARGGRY
eukprot:Skav232613  [mRNA]  locus=scaffold1224:634887:636392:+ [translate_table: standard]